MKKLFLLLPISGPAMAHSGRGTAEAFFHVHGAEFMGAGLVVLSALAVPVLVSLWRRLRA